MKKRALLKTVAKSVAFPWRWRQLNYDVEAVIRGPNQTAYRPNWKKIKKRYLRDQSSLKWFLQKLASQTVSAAYEMDGENRFFHIFKNLSTDRISLIETQMGIPKGLISTYLDLHWRKIELKQLEKNELKRLKGPYKRKAKRIQATCVLWIKGLSAEVDILVKKAIANQNK